MYKRRGTGVLGASKDPDEKNPPSPSRKGGWAQNLYIHRKYYLLQKDLGLGRKGYFVQSTNNIIYYQERQKYI